MHSINPARARAAATLAVIVVCVASFLFSTIRTGTPWNDDIGQYLQHARNIVERTPYSATNLIIKPGIWTPGPRTYPPVFPLLIAPAYGGSGFDFSFIKKEIVITFVLGIAVIFFTFEAIASLTERAAIALIVGFNPAFWDFKDNLIPDLTFMLTVYLALSCMDRLLSNMESPRRGWIPAIGCGVVIYLAYATKLAAIVLIPVPILFVAIRDRRLRLEAILISGTASALIVIQFLATRDISFELKTLQMTRSRVPYSIWMYFRFYIGAFSRFFSGASGNAFRWCIFLTLAALAFAGLYHRLKHDMRVWEIFGALYLVLIFSWEQVEVRYLFPLFPIFLLYAFLGLRLLCERRSSAFTVCTFGVILLLISIGYAKFYAAVDLRHLENGITAPPTEELYAFVESHLTVEDVIEFSHPRILAFFTGRHTTTYYPIAQSQPDQALWGYLRASGATYVSTSNLDQDFWVRFVDANHDAFKQVFGNSEFKVYRIVEMKDDPPAN